MQTQRATKSKGIFLLAPKGVDISGNFTSALPGSISAMSGLSILRMPSMEAALEAAQACPFLEINGTLEVSEMIEMSGQSGSSGNETIN